MLLKFHWENVQHICKLVHCDNTIMDYMLTNLVLIYQCENKMTDNLHGIFKSIFLYENLCILILIPQTFIPKSPESKCEWLNGLNILFYLVQDISGQAQHVRKYFIHSDLSIYFHAGASGKVNWIKLVSTNEFSIIEKIFPLEW